MIEGLDRKFELIGNCVIRIKNKTSEAGLVPIR